MHAYEKESEASVADEDIPGDAGDEVDEGAPAKPFQVSLPPPFPPFPPFLGGHGEDPRDVVFFAHAPAPPPRRASRDAEDIMLRRVPSATAKRFRAAAGGRGMTHAQYLAALVALHDAMRALADGGGDQVRAELDRQGLASVTV